jgi:hypothetical protein
VNEHLKYNSLISDEERKHMGLLVRDRKPAPPREPDSLPVVSVKLPSPGVIELHVVDSKSGRRTKPEGVHGYEIKYAIVDALATDWAQLIDSTFSTRSTFRMTFSGKQRGKMLSFALRYENTRGVKGPWTEIITTVIP